MMKNRIIRLIGLACILVLVSGCYQKRTNGNESIYTFAIYVKLGVPLAGLLLIPIGMAVRRFVSRKWGMVCLLMTPLIFFIATPSMLLDYLRVNPKEFGVRYGFWFSPTVVDIPFENLTQIRYGFADDNRSRMLFCDFKDGTRKKLSAGDLIQFGVPEVLDQAKKNGVKVISPFD